MDTTAPGKSRLTAEEYFRLVPETTQQTELLDGEIVSPASPTRLHQKITGGVFAELRQYIRQSGGKCEPYVAPMDVRLDDYSVVQPDVFVICDTDKMTEHFLNGAPDLAVEVVSSNRSDDFDRKLLLYRTSGVREYWIIDPFHETTVVYFFEEGNFPNIYTFDTPIPVGIYGGTLAIRIADIL